MQMRRKGAKPTIQDKDDKIIVYIMCRRYSV